MLKSRTRANVTILQRLLTFVKCGMRLFRYSGLEMFRDSGIEVQIWRCIAPASQRQENVIAVSVRVMIIPSMAKGQIDCHIILYFYYNF